MPQSKLYICFMAKYTAHCPLRPAISRSANGQLEIWGGRFVRVVEEGTTLNDIEWVPTIPRTKNVEEQTFNVMSSKGDKTYVVTLKSNSSYTCTCKAFMFRRKCKHITAVCNDATQDS